MEYVKPDHIIDYNAITDETHWGIYYRSLDWTILMSRTLPFENVILKHYQGVAEMFIDPSKTVEIEYCDKISTTAETEYQYGRYQLGDKRYKVATITDKLGPQPFLDVIHSQIVVRK